MKIVTDRARSSRALVRLRSYTARQRIIPSQTVKALN